MTNSTTSVNPSEVGWQFVPQYYTFVNKQPHRLHCFYTKASTFIHGTEGEDGKPCFGQQEIHSKITSIGFQDCKVFIHSVDAQSSANGGIIIQVIGEMSNHGEAWRKFVQTFFLAEQPNGYFVLNDIFRFLKEEAVEDDQASDAESAAPEPAPVQEYVPAPPAPASPSPSPPPVEVQPERAPTPAPASAPPVEEFPAPVTPEVIPESLQASNGSHVPEPHREPTPAPIVERSPSPMPEPPATASPPVSPPAQPHRPLAAPPAPTAQPQQPLPTTATAAPTTPSPSTPAVPKTWAHLAAANSKKWGSAVAQESRGTSEAPPPGTVPFTGPQTPVHPPPRPQQQPQQPHSAIAAAQSVTTAQCFVKSVTDNVSEPALRQVLTQRFGPIKELEILRAKACAFLEFTQLDAAKRAIIASLPVPQGGEGGIRIENENGNHGRIIVETRKERGERPPPRGPPINGARGSGFRGRGGPGGRGRGVGGPK